MYKKYLESKLLESKQKYLNYKNKLTTILWQAENNYYAEKFEFQKENMRATWKLINNIIPENTNVGDKAQII